MGFWDKIKRPWSQAITPLPPHDEPSEKKPTIPQRPGLLQAVGDHPAIEPKPGFDNELCEHGNPRGGSCRKCRIQALDSRAHTIQTIQAMDVAKQLWDNYGLRAFTNGLQPHQKSLYEDVAQRNVHDGTGERFCALHRMPADLCARCPNEIRQTAKVLVTKFQTDIVEVIRKNGLDLEGSEYEAQIHTPSEELFERLQKLHDTLFVLLRK